MRKHIVGLLSTTAVAVGLTVLTQTPAEASVTCKEYLREDVTHHNDGSTGDDEWTIKHIVGFRWCKDDSGPDWAKPLYSIGMYNQEGTRMNCDTLTGSNVLLYVGYNPYMWSSNGANFNPGEFRAPCDPSTYNQKFQDYGENAPRLYVTDGRNPRWKSNWRIEKSGVFFQGSGTLSGTFRPCNGRGDNLCP